MAARSEQCQEWELWRYGLRVERADESGRQKVSLHMVHSQEWNRPCRCEALGRIDACREAGSHARPAGHRYKVWLLVDAPPAFFCRENDAVDGVVRAMNRRREAPESFRDQRRKVDLMRLERLQGVYAAIYPVVCCNLLVEMQDGLMSAILEGSIVFFEYRD